MEDKDLGFEQVQAGVGSKASVPEAVVVIAIREAAVVGSMIFVDKFLSRPNCGVIGRAIERWDGDPFLFAVH